MSDGYLLTALQAVTKSADEARQRHEAEVSAFKSRCTDLESQLASRGSVGGGSAKKLMDLEERCFRLEREKQTLQEELATCMDLLRKSEALCTEQNAQLDKQKAQLDAALRSAVEFNQSLSSVNTAFEGTRAENQKLKAENQRLNDEVHTLRLCLRQDTETRGDPGQRNSRMDIDNGDVDFDEEEEVHLVRRDKGKGPVVEPDTEKVQGDVPPGRNEDAETHVSDSEQEESDSDNDDEDGDPDWDGRTLHRHAQRKDDAAGYSDDEEEHNGDAAAQRAQVKSLAEDLPFYKLVALILNLRNAIGEEKAVAASVIRNTFRQRLHLPLDQSQVTDAAGSSVKNLPSVVGRANKGFYYVFPDYAGAALCKHKKLSQLEKLYSILQTSASPTATPSTPPHRQLPKSGPPPRSPGTTKITYTLFTTPKYERPRFYALARVLNTPASLDATEFSIREMIAEWMSNSTPEFLLEYTNLYRQNGLSFATPENAKKLESLLSKTVSDHEVRAQSLSKVLRSRPPHIPTFADDPSNAHYDVGIFCEHNDATCHYIERDRFGRMLYARMRGRFSRDSFIASQIPFEQSSTLQPRNDERQFVFLAAENRKAYFVVDINGRTMYGSDGVSQVLDAIRTHVGKDTDPFSGDHIVELQYNGVINGNGGAEVTPQPAEGDQVCDAVRQLQETLQPTGSLHPSQPLTTNPTHTPRFAVPLQPARKRDADMMSQHSRASSSVEDEDAISEDSRASKRSRTSLSAPSNQELYQRHLIERLRVQKPALSWESFLDQVLVVDQLKGRKECRIPGHPEPVVMNHAAIVDVVHKLSGANRSWVSRADISSFLKNRKREFNPVWVSWNELDLTAPVFYSKTLTDPEAIMGKACRGMEKRGLLEVNQGSSGERLMFRLTPHVAKALETKTIEFSFAALSLPKQMT
ncbi:hypothetical protein HK097_011242 [Rhizophlyctis rosea]|uniref:Uncharacterized protein n=1 Tax=Rhizophlyctis rosea TaxID=64517 RepID=A0AAD5S6P6_9FUNG|nr:hypothetical protein HK097_011242 [Rhizophlyctis rosea]